MLRTPFASERIQRVDPTTGIKVIQLTSYPSPSVHFPYDWPSVTPDNGRLVFYGQRYTAREAPWDIYRVDSDGLNLFQLTEWDGKSSRPSAVMTLDGTMLYAVWREDNVLYSVDVETGRIEDLVDLSPHIRENHVLSRVYMANMGKRLFVSMPNYVEGGGYAVGIDLATGVVKEYPDFILYACDQSSGRILVRKLQKLGTKMSADGSRILTNVSPEPMMMFSMNEDGSDEKFVAMIDMFGHSTTLGRTSLIQGTGQPPHRCIWIAEAEKEPYKLVEGPYFWHSGASFDAEWIVSDTNWPNEGLKLIHVPTRRWRSLCQNRGSQGHVQSGHAHPALSQDGRIAVFTSDRTGIVQVYVAHITDEFRESVIAGVLDRPNDKWM